MRNSKTPGILLLIDFEKAFDSLEWSFVKKTLHYFNFGPQMRKWVDIFYSDIESSIINYGHISERFSLGRGVRQGDPLSPYLFILATEILASTITNHEGIKGVKIDNSEYLISQLADDTTLFLDNDEQSFRHCMNTLKNFAEISGLKINYNKTLAIRIYLNDNIEYISGNNNKISWQTNGQFSLLGIKYDLDHDDFTKQNYEEKSKAFEKTLNCWNTRKLTTYGKICIIKSLALPKLVHLFSSLPNPTEDVFKKLESICFRFIWNEKSEKIKRTTVYNTYENGGFKMPDIRLFCRIQKLTWIKKLMDDKIISNWKTLFLSDLEASGGNYIWLSNCKQPVFIKHLNEFWKDVYDIWLTIQTQESQFDQKPQTEPLFHNQNIQINNKSIFYKEWFLKGVTCINDVIDETGNFYSWEQFSLKYDIKNQAFKYIALIHAVPPNWKQRIKDDIQRKLILVSYPIIQKLKGLRKPAKFFYNYMIEKTATTPIKSEHKWCKILNNEIEKWNDIYILPYKVTCETKLRYFQLKILHRTTVTNKWLYKCKISDSPYCTFCKIYEESIQHVFYECLITKNMWFKVADWLSSLDISFDEYFTQTNILLGNPHGPSFLEHIRLITMELIYNAKLEENENKLNLTLLKQIIKYKMKIEKNSNQIDFTQKWHINLINFFDL